MRGELLTATAYHFAPAEVLVAADEGACADALCTATQCASLSNVKRGAQRGSGVFVAAIVVGFAFGAADQYLGSRSATLGPWVVAVSLASAPWLVLPFAFGCGQVRARRAMALGLVVTMAALAGYCTLMWSPLEGVTLSQALPHLPTLLRSQWLNFCGGLVTGPLFGLLGQRWRSDRSWLSAALVAGALCLEPLARWLTGRLLPPASVWAVEIAAGVVLALCFVVAGVARERGTA